MIRSTMRAWSAVLSCLAFAATATAVDRRPGEPDPAALLRSGPMVGPAEIAGTTLWLQTRVPCRAQIRYWERDKPETARLSAEVETAAATDLIARFSLDGLAFATRYDYELYLDGRRVPLPHPLTFQTLPFWRNRTPPPDFRFATGSCAYFNEPRFDRPHGHNGKPYGGPPSIFTAIARASPDFMLWLGDNVYYREPDWLSEAGMRGRWAVDRGTPELQALLGAAHHYATWDDHDYGPNNSDRSFRLRETSLAVFRDYWMNPSYGTLEAPGVFTRFEWSDAEFFLVDDRFHRSPNDMPEGPAKQMLGRAQLDWLKEALASSQATFKIIVSGSQMMNGRTQFEDWAHFPAEQGELLDFLRAARIEGVVFLSGDRHHTELLRRQEPGLYPLYEFTSSPLTSTGRRIPEEESNPLRVPGTWVTATHNFGIVEVTGPPEARVLTLRTLDGTGKELWQRQIRREELGFGAPAAR